MTLIKSISGIRGTIGGKAGEGLSPIDIVKFSCAFAHFLQKRNAWKPGGNPFRMVVGRDGRLSGAMVDDLVKGSLSGMGVKTQVLSQELDDAQRDQAVRRVMKGPALCTVCTDLVGRGLDTRAVSLVVQYDFATDVSAFLHRCGRTGRNGAPGEVVCFVSPENELLASRIQVPCERSCFTVEMRRAQRSERSVLPEASAAKEGEERRGVLCLFHKKQRMSKASS